MDAKRFQFLQDVGPGQGSANQRRFGRVVCQDVTCSLGEVMDLSAGGLRVRSRKALPAAGKVFSLSLRGFDEEISVTCTCRWSRRAGLFRHEAGLEFTDLTPEQRRSLTALARASAHNETILKGRG